MRQHDFAEANASDYIVSGSENTCCSLHVSRYLFHRIFRFSSSLEGRVCNVCCSHGWVQGTSGSEVLNYLKLFKLVIISCDNWNQVRMCARARVHWKQPFVDHMWKCVSRSPCVYAFYAIALRPVALRLSMESQRLHFIWCFNLLWFDANGMRCVPK